MVTTNDELRKVERRIKEDNSLTGQEAWEVIRLSELKEGDVFRMTEPGEKAPFGTWMAGCDAFVDRFDGEERWMVEGNPSWNWEGEII